MTAVRVAIVGGGLAGLCAAHVLEQHGITDWVLLEARASLGGRIAFVSLSGLLGGSQAPAAVGIDLFDVGPTWFWPELQPQLSALVRELGLAQFAQHEDGDMLVAQSPHAPPVRRRGHPGVPTSMRLVGGMGALTTALAQRLGSARLLTGQRVRQLRLTAHGVELDSEGASGRMAAWGAEHVLLALPPRLAHSHLAFTPPLPPALAQRWQATATWMAPHAKYIAVYDTPFWREQGLSGEARSAVGPLGEIHDASMPGGSAALFGFLGVPAQARHGVPEDSLRQLCRQQLAHLFGPPAAHPLFDALKDWAQDPLTATAADWVASSHHATAPPAAVAQGPWAGRLAGIASEWSPQFPGYLAGAVEAAHRGVGAFIQAHAQAHGGAPRSHGPA